jgi:hypothetical protein
MIAKLQAVLGGKARAKKLSPEQRKSIAQNAINTWWERQRRREKQYRLDKPAALKTNPENSEPEQPAKPWHQPFLTKERRERINRHDYRLRHGISKYCDPYGPIRGHFR